MRKNVLYKKICCSLVTFSLCCGAAAYPLKAEAFDLVGAIGAVVSVSAQYAYLDKQVNYINHDGRDNYMSQVKEKYGVCDEPRANEMLADVMERLSAAVAKTDPSITKEPYNYFVNNQTTFNAFCTLGHNMSVNIGLFNILNYNEDEIAFVVGHEMAHGQRNDPANGVRQSLPLQLLTALYQSQNPGAISVISSNILQNIGTAKGITLPMEKKADEMSFTYAVGANYNVGAGAAVWQRVLEKMGENKENFVSELFSPSDHPQHKARRDKFNERITEYSNKVVKVDGKTGIVYVKNKAIGAPAALSSMSTLERAYLVGGNLAAVYHNKRNISSPPNVYLSNGTLYLGQKAIMTITDADNGNTLLNNLRTANAAQMESDDED